MIKFTIETNNEFTFDDKPIKEELDGMPLTEPSVLAFIRELLQEGVGSIQRTASKSASLSSQAIVYTQRT